MSPRTQFKIVILSDIIILSASSADLYLFKYISRKASISSIVFIYTVPSFPHSRGYLCSRAVNPKREEYWQSLNISDSRSPGVAERGLANPYPYASFSSLMNCRCESSSALASSMRPSLSNSFISSSSVRPLKCATFISRALNFFRWFRREVFDFFTSSPPSQSHGLFGLAFPLVYGVTLLHSRAGLRCALRCSRLSHSARCNNVTLASSSFWIRFRNTLQLVRAVRVPQILPLLKTTIGYHK